MEKDIQEIKETLVEIKTDLKYHVKRTEDNERMLHPMWKVYTTLKYGSVLIVGLGAVATAIAKLKGYF